MELEGKKYIFFLQLQSLDQCPEYFVLAKLFNRLNFQLVPIDIDELSEATRNNNSYLLVLTLNLSSFRKFNSNRKQFIDFALKSKKLMMFHLNSFGEIKELNNSYLIKGYKTMSPPISYQELVASVIENYQQKMTKEEKWPGGRRARLPEMGG